MSKENDFERRFALLLTSVGIEFSRNPVVRTEKPVMDKDKKWKKTVTTPDFLVKFPCEDEVKEIFVEVTENNGNWEHKRAQHRVIFRAGLQDKYTVIHGTTILVAENIGDINDRRRFLLMKIGFKD